MIPIRGFSYLDTKLVRDSISALEGYLSEQGSVKDTKQKQSKKGLAANLKAVGGEIAHEGSESTERVRDVFITESANFQKLYSYLEKTDSLKYFEILDEDLLNDFSRGEVIEVQVNIRLSKLADMMIAMEMLQGFVSEETNSQLLMMQQLLSGTFINGIPVIMSMVSSPEIKLVCSINTEFLLTNIQKLVGEMTVLCKIQRKIKSGEKYQVVNILKAFESLAVTPQIKKQFSQFKTPKEIDDVVRGPGIIVIPIAIYS